ncbi:amiloride-sensitive sodium channel subunit alpha [Trichonephila clavipes]|uniref:Amiloride-sensitive sodium channel subunit alpha n=1 Tax=Trichonephila clavipes TaxID=2585209 RepID=A0A8X7BL68_TRICX|nr:amiloride-sensitive sodium channel subunit alpha [Trichonephila clavipes]
MKSEFETCMYDVRSSKNCGSVNIRPASGSKYGEVATNGPLVLPERRNYHPCSVQFNGDLRKKLGQNENFLDKYFKQSIDNKWKYGHQYKDLIEECSFRDKSCENHFSLLNNSRYGNCFTFNKLNGLSVTSASASLFGSAKGLELVLNAEINDYVAISHTVEFRIVIHDPFEEPDPEGKRMNISPGYETNVLLKQTLIKRLPVLLTRTSACSIRTTNLL